ncbi:MAG: hypothetical protein GY719_10265 [bacterium]|nr:hypothetical protein [bacterium]
MSGFFEAAFTMPTTVFSVLLILVIFYWLTVILGVMDLGILDGLFESADALAEGAVAGVEGAAEGLAEGAAEALSGAADGLADVSLADGAGEGAGEAIGEHQGCLGLAGVPFTVIGSVLVFFSWAFSMGGVKLAAGIVQGALAVALVGACAVVLSLATTAVALRPLKQVFRLAPVTGRQDLVGRICTVTTLRIDERFGQAEVVDKGAAILIQARCTEANELKRGSKALVCHYDAANEVFHVTQVDEGLAELAEETDSNT